MGSLSEMGRKLRKLTIVSMRIFYKSICNHPFVFGVLLLMIFLNRSFPFLFSLLVSASPVLISTALLLGTLLSFGQPNIPEIELEEKLNSDVVASLKAGISANNCAFIVEQDETFSMERYVAEKSIGKTSSEDSKASNEKDRDVPVGYVPLLDDDLQEIQTQKKVIEVVGRDFRNTELEKEKESQKSHEEEFRSESVPNNGEAVENHYGYNQEIRDEIFSMRVSESLGESVEAHKQDHFNYSAVGGGDNDDEDDEDESVDSGSDRAESSSPDASISDIIPMLDELHPLLDEEAPRTTQLLPDDSDVASEQSHRSSDGSEELDENMENQRDAGVDNDDDDEAHGGKEDESKSAIKWTEDDEKNLMDLGTLELERNQRLESLIARRRARKSFKLMAERNLIDLESSEILFNVPPISVTRQNPFDLPFASYDSMGLLPIPGSAPSVLLARRNPFDLPYEPNEEKPDLKGDDFEQEFSTVHQRDMVPRRYESFSTGPSRLAGSRQERQDFKWRPAFVAEGFASEGASCSSFHRQSSEVSDSKLSSVPDTDLVSSDSDSDEEKLNEPDHSKETDLVSNVSAHESQSSEELDTLELMQAEKGNVQNDETEIILGGVENHSEMELNFSVTGKVATATHLELSSRETHFMAGPAEGEESSGPSLSLLSEVGEKSHDVQKRDASTSVEVKVDNIDQSSLSVQPSLEESEIQSISEVVDDSQHKEPVYDTSPPSDEKEKLLSFSSISSTTEAESSTIVTPIASEEMAVMVDKQESELYSVSAEQNSSVYHEISTKAQATDGFGVRLIDDSEISVVDGLKVDNKPTFEPCFDDHGILHEQADFHVLGTKSSSSTSDFRTIPSEGVELDLKDGILDAIVNEKNSQVTETYHPEGKVALESINEEVNESAEIDEGFLSELDTVGDFSLKEVGGESLASELKVEEANLGSEKIELSTIDSNPTDKKLVLPVLEARSIEDITVAFKQLDEGTDANEVILPSLIKNHQHNEESKDTHIATSNLQEVEARSLEDVHKASQQVSNDHVSDLPVLEARSIEDVEVALKQFHEGTDVNEVILPILSNDLLLGEESEDNHIATSNLEEVEARSSEDIQKTLKQVSNDDVSDLPVLEARSMEDIDVAFKKLHEETDANDVILPNLIKDQLLKEELKGSHMANLKEVEARSLEDTDKALQQVSHDHVSDLPVLEARSMEDIDVAFKQLDEGTDVNQVILPSLIKDQFLIEESKVSRISTSNLPEVEARSSEDIQKALKQVSNDHVSDLPVHEARSMEDIDVAFKQLDEGTDANEIILPSLIKDQLLKEKLDTRIATSNLLEVEARSSEDSQKALKQVSNDNVSDLPVLEARSMEDIDVAFKQLDEGTDVSEIILPSLIKDKLLKEEPKDTHIARSNLREVEARSLEDIHKALQQLSNDHVSDIPVLEARSIEAIDVALKQFHEGKDLNFVEEQSKDGQIANSDMQEVEAKSLKDIALKQVQDLDVSEPSKLLNCKIEEPLEVTSVEERSEITSNELEGLHETLEISESSTLNSTDKEEVNAYNSNSDFSNINSSSSDSVKMRFSRTLS